MDRRWIGVCPCSSSRGIIRRVNEEFSVMNDMKLNAALAAKRSDILRIAAKHGAGNIRIFGSVARGETGPSSDIDLLVEMEPGRSLLDHTALWQDLEELLECKVDVVSEKALHPLIRKDVLAEVVPL